MIKRVIKRLFKNQIDWYRYKTFDDSIIIYKEKSYKEYLHDAIVASQPKLTESEKKVLCYDIFKQWRRDGTRPDEYLLYGYEDKSEEERDKYMPQVPKDNILLRYYGNAVDGIVGLLKDKYAFYEAMKPFFKREAIRISKDADKANFEEFCKKSKLFICKLLKGSCGVGVQIIRLNEDNRTVEQIFYELLSQGEWIVEELINQHDSLAQFNVSSVNTIRFPSFKHGNIIVPALPCLRLGRKGNIVDNAGQGGVFVSVDVETGEIITDAFDELGHRYLCHPDTGVTFKGYVIPQWEDLLDIVVKAHLALPEDQTYVAFDFALSDKGWVVVEGNWGDWIMQQTSLEKGLRKEFISLLHG